MCKKCQEVFCLKQTYVNSKLGSFSYEDNRLIKESSSYPDKKNRKKLIRNFIDCLIEKKTSPIITIKEQIDLMSVCFAVDKSLKLNKTLKIKYF